MGFSLYREKIVYLRRKSRNNNVTYETIINNGMTQDERLCGELQGMVTIWEYEKRGAHDSQVGF